MIKLSKNCSVCQVIRKEGSSSSKLLKRLFDSRAYTKDGEPLTEIHRDYSKDFAYASLYNHSRFHQGLSAEQIDQKKVEQAEGQIVRKARRGRDVRSLILEKGYEAIQSGEVKLNATVINAAAKHDDDIQLKEADQQLQFMAMIQKFASGELERKDGEEGYRLGDATDPAADSFN